MCAAYNTPQTPTTTLSSHPALIRVTSNNSSTVSKYKLSKARMSIGRTINCDISINEDIVSEPHFEIEIRNGLYHLVHPHPSRAIQGTANGFFYQGKQFRGNDSFDQILTHGDVFRISEPNGTMVSIAFDDGSGDIQNIPPEDIHLRKNTLTLGRAPDNDVHLNHETVSSHHARLEKHRAGYRIIDLQSTNHVYVNNIRTMNHALVLGDEIKIGPFNLSMTATSYDITKIVLFALRRKIPAKLFQARGRKKYSSMIFRLSSRHVHLSRLSVVLVLVNLPL